MANNGDAVELVANNTVIGVAVVVNAHEDGSADLATLVPDQMSVQPSPTAGTENLDQTYFQAVNTAVVSLPETPQQSPDVPPANNDTPPSAQ